jgi:hypothetical protein
LLFDQCPDECGYISSLNDLDGDPEVETSTTIPLAEGDKLYAFYIEGYLKIRTHATDLAIEAGKNKKVKTFEKTVPKHYHGYKDVFDKKDFDQLPDRRSWDHAIEITTGFEPVDCKIYPLNPQESPTV